MRLNPRHAHRDDAGEDGTATRSFHEDMAFDTPEAAANLIGLLESGVAWTRGDSKVEYVGADSDVVRRLVEKFARRLRSRRPAPVS